MLLYPSSAASIFQLHHYKDCASVLWACVEPALHFVHPRFARHETRTLPAHRFGASQDLVVGLIEIERLAAGLGRVEWRVAIELDRVAFGIPEVERPGISVIGHAMLGDSRGDKGLAIALERIERVQPERYLVHWIVRLVPRPTVEQHEL